MTITAIEQQTSSDNHQPLIYPNPASGSVTISSLNQGIGTVRITNVEGKVIIQIDHTELSKSTTIDLSRESKGIYTIQILAGDQVNTSKLVLNE